MVNVTIVIVEALIEYICKGYIAPLIAYSCMIQFVQCTAHIRAETIQELLR